MLVGRPGLVRGRSSAWQTGTASPVRARVRPSYCIRRSRTAIAQKGLAVLLIAKLVPSLDGITPPLAGMSGMRRLKFLLYDAGSTFWAGAFIGAGFLFAAELDKVAQYTSVFADALILVFGVPLLFFLVGRLMQLIRMIRLLRLLYITPEELKERLDAGHKVWLVDLLRFGDDPEDSTAIPGAVRADPKKMRRKTRVVVPQDVDLVLYRGSKNSFVSAHVAAAMRKKGIRRIRVLEGGLAAWKSRGFPLGSEVAEPYAEMNRLGMIEMFPPPRGPMPAKSADASY
jgi:rhodanese-related sulfurtransferase